MDIPELFAEALFRLDADPRKLRGRDFQTTRNYLQVSTCNIHDELTKRIDAPAAAHALWRR